MMIEEPAKPLKYPKSVYFIVINEFCERFTYYGMRAVLSIYLNEQLKFDPNTATVIYHAFTMMVYFFPLFGGMIADSFLGKFKTIFILSVIYVAGNSVIATSAFPGFSLTFSRLIALLGLLLIAIGTGGIKPCVSSFGGDQFKLPEQERQLAQFFSLFYFAINSGSLISTIITPIFRENVQCMGMLTCYPLAFGVPGLLMVVALVVFLMGRSMYDVKKPTGNVILNVFNCIVHALSRRSKLPVNERKKEHWLDYASDKFDPKFISDIQQTLRVFILYIPLPVFWALFDQQGSRWTFQAVRMNGNVLDWFTIKPDQMQVANPLLILIFIPLFDYIIYPCLTKCHILTKPLHRLITGGLLAAAAFIFSGFLELALQQSTPPVPVEGFADIRLYNGLNCDLNVHVGNDMQEKFDITVGALKLGKIQVPATDFMSYYQAIGSSKCASDQKFAINVTNQMQMSYFFDQVAGNLNFMPFDENANIISNHESSIRFLVGGLKNNSTIELVDEKSGNVIANFTVKNDYETNLRFSIPEGKYVVKINGERALNGGAAGLINAKRGGIYAALINDEKWNLVEVASGVQVHMLWLLPQYIVMTLGEVMFSITGLDFSYSQAPISMKSVVSSAWLLTTAFGNLIVVIIAEARFTDNQAIEFFGFAALMTLTMIIFAIMARSYEYVDAETESLKKEKNEHNTWTRQGIDNCTFKGDSS